MQQNTPQKLQNETTLSPVTALFHVEQTVKQKNVSVHFASVSEIEGPPLHQPFENRNGGICD